MLELERSGTWPPKKQLKKYLHEERGANEEKWSGLGIGLTSWVRQVFNKSNKANEISVIIRPSEPFLQDYHPQKKLCACSRSGISLPTQGDLCFQVHVLAKHLSQTTVRVYVWGSTYIVVAAG